MLSQTIVTRRIMLYGVWILGKIKHEIKKKNIYYFGWNDCISKLPLFYSVAVNVKAKDILPLAKDALTNYPGDITFHGGLAKCIPGNNVS